MSELQLVLSACGALAAAIGVMWQALNRKIERTEKECAEDRAFIRRMLAKLHVVDDDGKETA